jgi:hypothetical protein
MVVPPAVVWTLGALGTALLSRLLIKEWQRINAELDRVRHAPEPGRQRLPTLRRDPRTGVYRP